MIPWSQKTLKRTEYHQPLQFSSKYVNHIVLHLITNNTEHTSKNIVEWKNKGNKLPDLHLVDPEEGATLFNKIIIMEDME